MKHSILFLFLLIVTSSFSQNLDSTTLKSSVASAIQDLRDFVALPSDALNADDIQDKQHNGRGQRAHTQRHQTLHQGKGGRQIEPTKERRDDVESQRSGQIVHQEYAGQKGYVAALACGDHPGSPANVAFGQHICQLARREGARGTHQAGHQGQHQTYLGG